MDNKDVPFAQKQKHSLFKLKRIVSLHTGKRGNGSGGRYRGADVKEEPVQPLMTPASFRLVAVGGVKNRMEVLAMYCTNDYLILRKDSKESVPIVKMMAWYRSSVDRIVAMDFSPEAKYLLCVTASANLVVLNVEKILLSSDLVEDGEGGREKDVLAESEELPSLYSYLPMTPSPGSYPKRKPKSTKQTKKVDRYALKSPMAKSVEIGLVTCCAWWRTWNGVDYAVIGTTEGLIVFYNLTTHNEQFEVRVHDSKAGSIAVHEFSLLINPTMQNKTLIMRCADDKHYELLLEHESENHTYMLVVHNMTKKDFLPRLMKRFSNAKSIRVFKNESQGPVVAVHTAKNTLEIYDAHMTRFPLFVYRLPLTTKDVIITKRFLFVTHYPEGDMFPKSFSVMSKHLAGIGIGGENSQLYSEADDIESDSSIMYTFLVPDGEIICGVSSVQPKQEIQKERTAKMLLEKPKRRVSDNPMSPSTNDADDILDKLPETLDMDGTAEAEQATRGNAYKTKGRRRKGGRNPIEGIYVWTEQNLYEVVPINTVTSIFRELAREGRDLTECELFAKSVGGDVYKLYEQSADHCFEDGDYDGAYNMYMLSNVNTAKFVFRFLSIDRIEIVNNYLENLLRQPGSLERGKELRVCSLLLLLKVFSYLSGKTLLETLKGDLSNRDGTTKEIEEASMDSLRRFVLSREQSPPGWALVDLLTYGFIDIFFELAERQDNIAKALDMLVSRGILVLSSSQIDFLKKHGAYQLLHSVRRGVLFRCLPSHEQVKLLLSTQESILKYGVRLLYRIPYLSADELRFVISKLDPERRDIARLVAAANPVISSISGAFSQGTPFGNVRYYPYEGSMFGSSKSGSFSGEIGERDAIASALQPQEVLEMFITAHLALEFKIAEDGDERAKGRAGVKAWAKSGYDAKVNIHKVSAGHSHLLILTENGQVFSLGNNQHGQLGLADELDRSEPTKINGFCSEVVAISCGKDHSAAVTSAGQVYTWGSNEYGQLGLCDSSIGQISYPEMVIGPLRGINAVDVACGYFFTHVLTDTGDVFAFGSNDFGQLGVSLEDEGDSDIEAVDNVYTPTRVELPQFPETIPASPSVSIPLDTPPPAFSQSPASVSDSMSSEYLQKVHTPRISSFASISSGYCHTLAVADTGELFAWGHNGYGQLGIGQKKQKLSRRPVKVDFFTGSAGKKVTKVACGNFHTAVLTEDGSIYMFGKGQKGRLGLNYTQFDYSLPQKPSATCLMGVRVSDVACGHFHTICCSNSGKVYVWGHNSEGQLGLGDESPRLTPVTLPLDEETDGLVFSVECGEEFSIALTSNNTLLMWGSNSNGQIGMPAGTQEALLSPSNVLVPALMTHMNEVISGESGASQAAGRDDSTAIVCNTLKKYAGQYHPERILMRALDWRNWNVVTLILEMMGEQYYAAYYMLKGVEDTLYGTDGQRKTSNLIDSLDLDHVVTRAIKIAASGAKSGLHESLMVITLLLHFWSANRLDPAPLENGLINNIGVCIRPLTILIEVSNRLKYPKGFAFSFMGRKDLSETVSGTTAPTMSKIESTLGKAGGKNSSGERKNSLYALITDISVEDQDKSPQSPGISVDVESYDVTGDSSLDSFGEQYFRSLSDNVSPGVPAGVGARDADGKQGDDADDGNQKDGIDGMGDAFDAKAFFSKLGVSPPPGDQPFYVNFSHKLYIEVLSMHIGNLKSSFEEMSNMNIEKTWNDVRYLLQKDLERRKSISLPIERRRAGWAERDRELRQMGNKSPTAEGTEANQWYVFTCGHTYDRGNFTTKILPKFESLLEDMFGDSAPISTTLFLHSYSKDTIRLACPICVYNYLKSDRMLSTKYPSKEWTF